MDKEKSGDSSEDKTKFFSMSRARPTIENNPYFTIPSKKKRLPSLLDHFNSRDLKELFKCSLAAWVTVIFILIGPVLDVFGQAAFFGTMIQFISPPSGVAITHFLAGATVLIGICLGWAWGVITMKAALATRPEAEVNARIAELRQLSSGNTTNPQQASGQAAYAQVAIFDGFMLDTRVTVTYFCMIGLFIYFMARLRIAYPKLTLVSMFGMIVSDIFLAIAPLVPTFQGEIPRTFAIPAAASLAVGMACALLFFPRSASSVVRDEISNMLQPVEGYLHALVIHLENPDQRFRLEHLLKIKGQVVGAYGAKEAAEKLLTLDISFGKWGPKDTKSLHDPVRKVLFSFMSLLQMMVNREHALQKKEELEKQGELISADAANRKNSILGIHQITRTLDFRTRMHAEDRSRHISKGLMALYSSSDELAVSCIEAVLAIQEIFKQNEGFSTLKKQTQQQAEQRHQHHVETLIRLRQQLGKFIEVSTQDLLQEHQMALDAKSRLGDSRTGLVLGMMLANRISSLGESLADLLARLIDLELHGKKNRLWLPNSGLRTLGSWALDNESPAPGSLARSVTTDQSDDQQKKNKRRKKQAKADQKDKPSRAKTLLANMHHYGGYQRGKTAQLLLSFYHWLFNSEGMFAIRVLVATIALAIPGVVPASAGFYYREKGLWVLIMAQTGLVEFTADFVVGFAFRVAGTVIGGVLGMVVWYVGAGNGLGNPYGMAAIMAVAIVTFMWLRLFAPPALLQGTILMAATLLLVMAYSWVDTHIPSYGNPGVGYAVFWRRMLLVLIGLGAAAVVTFIPRPPSANRHYRKVMSSVLQGIQERYILFATVCSDSSSEPWDDVQEVAEKYAIETTGLLLTMSGPIQATKYEFSSSPFSAAALSRICSLCIDMNHCLTRLLVYSVDRDFRPEFIRTADIIEDHFFANLMAVLTLLQETLVTGRPLPAVLPVPLLTTTTWARKGMENENSEFMLSINKDTINDVGFRKYAQALSAFVQMTGCIDEMVMIVKKAVGESGVSPGLSLNKSFLDAEAQR